MAALLILSAGLITLIVMTLTTPPDLTDDARVTVHIDRAEVLAEVAVSAEKQARGLGGRESLGGGEGMLFAYTEAVVPGFWMKDVTFPIDIVWIRGDTVTGVTAKVPPPKAGTAEADLPRYRPPGPVDRVLETNAGWTAEHSIQPGDPVRITR
ncbi:MAG: DUF192 domain-containing protein [bacterium]|nr:DUF192 domain-containing protein [bacterium]